MGLVDWFCLYGSLVVLVCITLYLVVGFGLCCLLVNFDCCWVGCSQLFDVAVVVV